MLQDEIALEIKLNGPITLARFMSLCLSHPTYGYYKTRDPLGRDFTTSPEISQIFGEIIALWIISKGMLRIKLCEAGPGRGTLSQDILRILHKFNIEVDLHLVEINPVLRAEQAKRVKATWHETIPDCDIFIANEFVDCLPIRQFIKGHERVVGLNGETLTYGLVPSDQKHEAFTEICDYSCLNKNVKHGLIIDYGYIAGSGDTFQAMKAGEFIDPLTHLGEADLTAHVDFKALQAYFGRGHIKTQHDFLVEYGFYERLKALKPHGAERLVDRTTPVSMGQLFKVLEI